MPDSKQSSQTESLDELARKIRLDILDMTTRAGSGHPSSSWSSVEILVALFFGGLLKYKPGEPWWPERDRFIMSKGHGAPALYARGGCHRHGLRASAFHGAAAVRQSGKA